MCFGCSKEPSHRDGSFEYPQHMFWLRNKKDNFPVCMLIRRPDNNFAYYAYSNGLSIEMMMERYLFISNEKV